jgi:hypothetical protein
MKGQAEESFVISVRYGVATVAALSSLALFSATAEANRRCGFDRYGYHPPDFRGCYDYGIVEVPVPVAVPVVPVVGVPPPAPVYRRHRVGRVHKSHRVRRVYRARPVVAFAPPLPPPPPPPPFEGYYRAAPPPPGCYYDNGYDMAVHIICYRGW